MSTTATTPSHTASTSSLAASSRFKTFATTFSISGTVIYCVIQYLNWPLFTFHPATNRIVWGYEAARSGEGPNMLWYGWSATTILIAAAVGIIATLLPARITNKIPLSLVWVFPILAIPYVVYSLNQWWILASK
jgi:hypothetical protein